MNDAFAGSKATQLVHTNYTVAWISPLGHALKPGSSEHATL